MKKSSGKKIALALACASIFFGERTQTMSTNKHQSPQTIAAVEGATFNNKIKKYAIIGGIGVVAAAAIGTTLYFLLRNKKQVKSNEIDENKNKLKGNDNVDEKELLRQIENQNLEIEKFEN